MKYIQGMAHVVCIYTLVFYSVGSTKKTRRLEQQWWLSASKASFTLHRNVFLCRVSCASYSKIRVKIKFMLLLLFSQLSNHASMHPRHCRKKNLTVIVFTFSPNISLFNFQPNRLKVWLGFSVRIFERLGVQIFPQLAWFHVNKTPKCTCERSQHTWNHHLRCFQI